MLHFLKDCWKFIQIHQYYTMALRELFFNITQLSFAFDQPFLRDLYTMLCKLDHQLILEGLHV